MKKDKRRLAFKGLSENTALHQLAAPVVATAADAQGMVAVLAAPEGLRADTQAMRADLQAQQMAIQDHAATTALFQLTELCSKQSVCVGWGVGWCACVVWGCVRVIFL